MTSAPRTRTRATVAIGLILAGALVLAIAFAELAFEVPASAGEIGALIRESGPWGVAVSIALMVVHSFVPFPAELVALANGMIYGPLWGTAITWSGAMLGAYLAFGLARLFGRPFLERAMRRRDWHHVDAWVAERGGWALFVSRFIPVISFNLINYVAGVTNISWWTFTWATGLGILPLTAIMVYMGAHIDALPWQAWLGLFGIGLTLWFAMHAYSRKRTSAARAGSTSERR